MTTLLDREIFEEAIDAVDRFAYDEITVKDNYSGRGMNGDTCVALTMNSVSDLCQVMFELGQIVERGFEEALESSDDDEQARYRPFTSLARRVRTDSMGTGIVAYFPGCKFETT